ncbi:MAG: tRNA epoxyqueuosine(34) reductase QueG [Acidobacteriota bacterium]
MDKKELTSCIREEGLKLGFSAVGVAAAEPLAGDLFREWLRRGYHAEMAYMARDPERRLDPAQVLPGARSVICTALLYRYPEPAEKQDPAAAQGRISCYAQGIDYHFVLQKKLETFAGVIGRLSPNSRARIYVDTGVVLEKSWAQKAGIGWQGKNTNILNRRLGSWFFLGEILTDLELEYDEPVPDYCGSCTRCIEACPTGALEPYVLDSRRCISYLTIENRGDIPEELREGTGDWIFGCDICQEVCPWNRKSPSSLIAEFQADPRSSQTNLAVLTDLTPEDFAERYRRSAIRRARWRGLLRNVAIALGNARDPEAVPALGGLLGHGDALVRRHAAWALAQIGSEEAFSLLEKRRAVETDRETGEALEKLLSGRRK